MFGSLKPGLEGDVVVYPFNPETDDDPEKIEQAFSNCSFLVKSGQLVIDKGEIIDNGTKRTLWVDAKVNENPQVMRDVEQKFLKYYSVNLGNYEVTGNHFVPNPYVIEVDATQ